jgi:hypothetical protein
VWRHSLSYFVALCNDCGVHGYLGVPSPWPGSEPVDDEGRIVQDLVALLAEELEATISDTVTEESSEPAREFTRRVIETDITTAEGDPDAVGLGQSWSFLVLAGWIVATRDRAADQPLDDIAVGWVGDVLGIGCAATARRATAAVGSPDNALVTRIAAELAEDFLPGLIWFAAGLITQYGYARPGWLGDGDT